MTATLTPDPAVEPVGTPIVAAPAVAPLADSNDRHFRTDHLHANLKGRSVRGGAITLGAQGCKFVLQIGSTAVLARLLTPADYGLIAMVAVFTGFVSLFKDLGLSMATVQRGNITHQQVSTLFWINVLLSAGFSLIGIVLAPAIGWFYNEPRLIGVSIAISATFVFGGLSAQHTALLRRQMKFHLLAISDIATLLIGISAAIALALMGAGYWALVGMIAAEAAAAACFAWAFSGWWPGIPVRGSGVRPMIAFGGRLVGTNICNYALRNADNVLLGWAWGPGAVGLYAKAYQLLMLPVSQASAPISAVALPALSRIQQQPTAFRRYYQQALVLVTSVSMPISALMLLLAKPVVLITLGNNWTAAIPIFQILAIASFVESLNVTHAWLFVPFGQTARLLRCAVARTVVTVIAFAIGIPWGPMGVAVAYVVSRYLTRLPELWYATRGTPLSLGDALKPVAGPATCAIGSFAITGGIQRCLPGMNPVQSIVALGTIFGLVYSISWLLWPRHLQLMRSVLTKGM